ncbi:MAG: helix-turn-helix transcriptional regulator [Flavobacteriales bacterium]|nr:helix-turn-helix transcriptional regulator [Flavobacteriales bacterium]
MSIRIKFAKRVLELRKEQGLSQANFAIKVDVDRTTISKIELARRNVSIDTMGKIANGLDVDVAFLFIDK